MRTAWVEVKAGRELIVASGQHVEIFMKPPFFREPARHLGHGQRKQQTGHVDRHARFFNAVDDARGNASLFLIEAYDEDGDGPREGQPIVAGMTTLF